jgi:nucleoside-diphosphate-sugar epimerase
MIQRWVITGANGYLGGQLCKGLCAKGDKVVGIARPGRSLAHLEACGVVCHGYEDLPAVLSSGDIFIHCAGKVGNLGRQDEFINVNRDWSWLFLIWPQIMGYGVLLNDK